MIKNKIYRFLTSVRLAIVLLIMIALLCILCTAIPQNLGREGYLQQYGEGAAFIIMTLGLDHVLTSLWMYGTGGLFAVNLILCTWKRLQWAIACNKKSIRPDAWGSPILHLGLCIILAGAFIGMIFGWELYYEIPVGQKATVSTADGTFQMEVEDFTIDFYEDQVTPKQYRSRLRILEEGKDAVPMMIEVNSPGKYNGISMLQQDFGWELTFSVHTDQASKTYTIKNEDWLVLGGEGEDVITLGVAFYPDYDEAEGITGETGFRDTNPHLVWVLNQGENPIAADSVAIGKMGEIQEPLRISFDDYRYYTGLQVRYDPGIPVIYTGFFLLTAGLLIRFLWKEKKESTNDNNNRES